MRDPQLAISGSDNISFSHTIKFSEFQDGLTVSELQEFLNEINNEFVSYEEIKFKGTKEGLKIMVDVRFDYESESNEGVNEGLEGAMEQWNSDFDYAIDCCTIK